MESFKKFLADLKKCANVSEKSRSVCMTSLSCGLDVGVAFMRAISCVPDTIRSTFALILNDFLNLIFEII